MNFNELTAKELESIDISQLSRSQKEAMFKRLYDLGGNKLINTDEHEEVPTTVEKLGDLVKSTGKVLVHGTALAPAYVADIPSAIANFGSWMTEKQASQPPGIPHAPFSEIEEEPITIPSVPYASDILKEKLLDKYMPLSDNEKIAREAVSFANPTAKISGVKNAISKAPTALKYLLGAPEGKKAIASATLGGAASESMRQNNPNDPISQFLATLAGQHVLSAPKAIKQTGSNIADLISKISPSKKFVNSIDIDPKAAQMLESIGEKPNIGLTSKSPFIRGLYQQAKSEPGSKIFEQEKGLYSKLNEDTLKTIEPELSLKDRVILAEEAKKTAKNVSKEKDTVMKALEEHANSYLPQEEIIELPNTAKAIKDFKKELEINNLSDILGDSKIPREARVLNELENGQASYKDTRFALREILNKKISHFITEGKVDEGRIKQLANAINEDIDTKFASKGEEALKARSEFNKYYQDYAKHIKPISNKIKEGIGGESVSILNKELFNKDSADKYLPRAFKNNYNPEQLAKGMLYQVGLEKNGDFNASLFYKNLDKIPQKNYDQIISHLPKENKKILDNMKFLNDHLSEIQKYKNFPNTAQHLQTALKTVTRIVVAGIGGASHGVWGATVGLGASEGLLRAATKSKESILTSPAFYNWVSKVDKAPSKRIAQEINHNYANKLRHLYPTANRFINQISKSITSDINDEEYED
jgi:hypothetical protein